MRSVYLLLAVLPGCYPTVAVNYVPTNQAPHALHPRGPSGVKIASTPPSEPFAEVGFIEGQPAYGSLEPPASILVWMQAGAGQWGCDVLLVSSASMILGRSHAGDSGIGYHGTCLVYLDDAKSAELAATAPVIDPTAPPPPSAQLAHDGPMLFRSKAGDIYRVQPESREEALRLGWVPVAAP